MTQHDFRYSLLSPQHTLNEVRALAPGRYQVTGTGGSIQAGDTLLVTLKGSRELFMCLDVEKVRHLINPPGQWTAVTRGPAFGELEIREWQVLCDGCGKRLTFEFAADATLGENARTAAAQARIAALGWHANGTGHRCPDCATVPS
jgi:hypothetical protein